MIWVTDAIARPDYRLWVRFSDGTAGEVDLKGFIEGDSRPIVAALRAPDAFAALRVDMDSVVWDNGFDLAPEFLYEKVRAHASA
ncbi:MAG TPA: DUF2442 domain-containing protein [Burkholderiales bacterium]|nr:DUF2442 domain-containing protein [Burkholderiales bacterium]